jgi:Spy/CpxP family protein refolding chaperone
MTGNLKWKLIAGFLLVFVAGGVTGAFLAAATARHYFMPPHRGIAAETMREHLRAQLKLTPEQTAKISPVIEKAGAQLEQIRMETERRVHETFAQVHREISADLTDEQRTKFERMRRRHLQWQHRMHPREPDSGDPPPPPPPP